MTPQLKRVRELNIGLNDAGTQTIMRLSCEFTDGEIRAQYWPLDEILTDMLARDTCIVTQEFQRHVNGDVHANPPYRQAAAPVVSGVSEERFQTVLSKVADAAANRIVEGEVKIAGALNEHAKVVRSLRTRIAELESKLEQK